MPPEWTARQRAPIATPTSSTQPQNSRFTPIHQGERVFDSKVTTTPDAPQPPIPGNFPSALSKARKGPHRTVDRTLACSHRHRIIIVATPEPTTYVCSTHKATTTPDTPQRLRPTDTAAPPSGDEVAGRQHRRAELRAWLGSGHASPAGVWAVSQVQRGGSLTSPGTSWGRILAASLLSHPVRIGAQEPLAVEVDEMRRAVGAPNFRLPRDLGQMLAHLGP